MEEMRRRILQKRIAMKGPSAREDTGPTAQQTGVPQPPLFASRGGKKVSLTQDFSGLTLRDSLLSAMNNRRSRRDYLARQLTLNELAFLLWMTQGVQETLQKSTRSTLRPVPSAGARHALETYLLINRVIGLEPGLYHYLAESHELEQLEPLEGWEELATEAFMGQVFAASAPVAFIWTAIPERMEWRYADRAQKYILLDAGHICQNLYLACEAIGCGTCAIGAYLQEPTDRLLGLEEKAEAQEGAEFVVYAASVGKV